MKPKLESIKKLGGFKSQGGMTGSTPEPKLPPPLSRFFMLSHLEEDGPVRLDGEKLAALEVMGLELDEPKLGAFAGALNAVDFPVQLLVRQHPPVLQALKRQADRSPARGPAPADQRRSEVHG